jgi:hypothetical protein
MTDETSPEALNCEDDANADEEASADGLDSTTEDPDEEREDGLFPEVLGEENTELGKLEEEIWRMLEDAIDESNEEASAIELDDTTTEIDGDVTSEDRAEEETTTEMSELELAYKVLEEAEEGEEIQAGIETPVSSPTKKARCVPAGGEASEQSKKPCEQEFVDAV